MLGKPQPSHFGVLAEQPNHDEQCQTGQVIDQPGAGEGFVGETIVFELITLGGNGTHAITTESSAGLPPLPAR